ncbi:MAG: (Fe-S)-binding protein [Deltaproteobacteria bacterium]|nr:(Fe-S)-binding protein [Deltaproteobacteria bacterium]
MSQDDTERKMLLQEFAKCRSCRFCVDVCPTYQASEGVESFSAYGRVQIIKYLFSGMLPFDDSLVYCLYSCLQCRRCDVVCKSKGQNLDVCELILRGRRLLSKRLERGGKHAKL